MRLRHRKAERGAPRGPVQDGRRAAGGTKVAAEIGGWIGSRPPFPDLVLVSAAVRAKQTWELAWETIRDRAPPPLVEFLPELYAATPTQLLQSIRAACATDPKQLMLVGHNPGLHELALALTCAADAAARQALADNLPTSGLP